MTATSFASSLLGGRRIEVPCTVEIERTGESFHAYAEPLGVEVGPGDTVLLHGAPSHVEFGEKRVWHCRATVIRAGLFGRLRARMAGFMELTELYEVGFQPYEESGA
jgi:hypothetical protein